MRRLRPIFDRLQLAALVNRLQLAALVNSSWYLRRSCPLPVRKFAELLSSMRTNNHGKRKFAEIHVYAVGRLRVTQIVR
jgi:hypothetical protein